MLEKINSGEMDLDNVWFTDESHIEIGYLNKAQEVTYSVTQPNETRPVAAHPKRITGL